MKKPPNHNEPSKYLARSAHRFQAIDSGTAFGCRQGRLAMIEIDGSILEGGGQILRTAVSLSAVTGKPVRVVKIRAKRANPGLRPQHLAAIKCVADMCNAKTAGLSIGSKEIDFIPGKLSGGSYEFDIGTAGSTTLALQALLPGCSFASGYVNLEIKGGTSNPMAPPLDFMQSVFLPTVRKLGFKGSLSLIRRGFYPKGGGIVRAAVEPSSELTPIILLEAGKSIRIRGIAYSCLLPEHIVDRMISHASALLKKNGFQDVSIDKDVADRTSPHCALDPGCGIMLFSEHENGIILGADSLGKLGKPAETVASEAVNSLLEQVRMRAGVDFRLADQLMVWMSLANRESIIKTAKLTLHAITSAEICSQVSGARFRVEGKENQPALIRCIGIGKRNENL